MIPHDHAFCVASCLNQKCPKMWAMEQVKFYRNADPTQLVAFADLSDGCSDYQPVLPTAQIEIGEQS